MNTTKETLAKHEVVVRNGTRYLIIGSDLKIIHRVRRGNRWQYCTENECQWCGTKFISDIYDDGKYCNHSCAAKGKKVWESKTINIPGMRDSSLTRRGKMMVWRAIKKGLLTRPTDCPVCKKVNCKIEGHHPSYYNPREINWVCVSCHKKIHHEHQFILELVIF